MSVPSKPQSGSLGPALAPLALLWRTPPFAAMTFAIFALGMGVSFAVPFMSLYGVQQIGMNPFRLGIFMTSMSVSSIALSTLLGRWSDHLSSRRPAVLVALGSGMLGYALLSQTHSYWGALMLALTFMALGAGSFPQLFAYARSQLAQTTTAQTQPELAEHGLTVLRSVFSLAWVAGPALGAVVLNKFHFAGLFLGVSALYLLAALPVLRRSALALALPAAPATSQPQAPQISQAQAQVSILLIALAFTLYSASLSAQMIALPLFVTQELHGTTANVGFLLGMCALLEIPIMISFVLKPPKESSERLLFIGFALSVLMTLMISLAPGLWLAVLAYVVRAVVIAISSCIGMSYFQDLMPGRMGAAITLFANTSSAGSVMAGLLVGGIAQVADYRAVFWACVVLCVAAWALLWRGTRRKL